MNVSPLATDAVAEPLAINGAADAWTLVINLPSPIKNPVEVISNADTDPLINVFDFICRDDPLGTPIVFVSTADAVKFPTTLTDSDEAFIIGLPLTKRDILFTLFN